MEKDYRVLHGTFMQGRYRATDTKIRLIERIGSGYVAAGLLKEIVNEDVPAEEPGEEMKSDAGTSVDEPSSTNDPSPDDPLVATGESAPEAPAEEVAAPKKGKGSK